MLYYQYVDDLGKKVNIEEIDKMHKYYEKAINLRVKMIEQLANYDEALADLYLMSEGDCSGILSESIDQAIAKAILSQKAVALFCGSVSDIVYLIYLFIVFEK